MRLLTNNPDKTASLEEYGVPVAERVPLTPRPNDHNLAYLLTKRDRMGHVLPDLRPEPATIAPRREHGGPSERRRRHRTREPFDCQRPAGRRGRGELARAR